MENISVIIRCKNESEFIGFAIQSCLDHFEKPEIVIVDNGSTDDSLEIVNLFKDRTTIKIISIDDYTPGKSINMGVKHCSNDYVLILSAHAQITNMNFKRVVKHFKNKNVAVFGNQIPIYRGKKISKRYIWSHFSEKETLDMYSDIEQRYFLHNAFCFYQKNVLINNPMPEIYSTKEDRYWVKGMIDKTQHYIYDPSISVNHFYTTNGATWKGIG
jgi:glycosyltransferase involved in cell wall biosynthesis|tara:strand:- start:30 stop:674 length:645 start_codon:yes stop_codon:yes gene_type:complete